MERIIDGLGWMYLLSHDRVSRLCRVACAQPLRVAAKVEEPKNEEPKPLDPESPEGPSQEG